MLSGSMVVGGVGGGYVGRRVYVLWSGRRREEVSDRYLVFVNSMAEGCMCCCPLSPLS